MSSVQDPLLFDRMFRSSNDPLIEDEEDLCLASIIYKLAKKEVGSYDEPPPGYDSSNESDTESVVSFDMKVEATRSNLKQVRDLFSKTTRARKMFLKNFPSWSILRQKNIEQLRKIARSIHGDTFNGNVSKLVGGCTGIVGGGAVIGTFLCPVAAPALIPLAIGGGIGSALGGGVVCGTSLTQLVLLKKSMKKTKAVIEKDKEAFSAMKHWFDHTKELMDAIQGIVGFELMTRMTQDVKRFVEEAKQKTQELKKGAYNRNFKQLLEKCVKGMCSSGLMQAKFGIHLAPVVMTFVFVFCLMNQRNRFLFESLAITHRLLGVGLLSFLDVGVELGRLVAGLAMRGGAAVLPRATAQAVTLGVFVGLGVALDLANVVLTSIDVHKGSLSEEAMMVDEVTNKLEAEFQFLEEVHEEVLSDITR